MTKNSKPSLAETHPELAKSYADWIPKLLARDQTELLNGVALEGTPSFRQ
jgi:hypothetical protein